MKEWEKFEEYICSRIHSIDKYAKRTPGSGNKGRKGDITGNFGLHIECKAHNKKNVYNENDFQKCKEEIPLHSENIPILFTKNKDGKMRVHLDADDFLDIYIEFFQLTNGGEWNL